MASVDLVDRWFREALKPDPILTVSQWADEHRILSRKASSEAGRWRTSRTPYLREIMDVLSVTHPCKKVVFKKGSQVGGTEAGNNWLGYIIDHVPGPTMLVLPTVDVAKRNSHLRIEPLIDECPRIKQKVRAQRSRDNTNTVLQKDFDGGTLILAGANSASGLKSTPARFVMLDEIDEYPANVEGQGDPIALVSARSRTFSRRKQFLVSTPTRRGVSKIDDEFADSDQRHFHVACPHCDRRQSLKWERLQWDAGKPETVLYYCEHCGAGIEERQKTKMLEGGVWIAENPGHSTVGFFLNALYSPIGWLSWAEIVADYEKAKEQLEKEKKDELMVTFWNTILGLSYESAGDAPEWERIYLRREKYALGTVAKDVGFITLGVDVQRDRLEAELVGWGPGKESWSIDYQIFRGDTSKTECWKELEEYFSRTFPREDGAELPIRLVAIDSGFNTQHVYNFCRRFPITRVVPIKGSESLSVAIGFPKAVDARMKGGKVKRRAVKVWSVGVNVLKTELYGFLKIDPPVTGESKSPGLCHFPEYDQEYFKQLTAEKVVWRRNRKGYAVAEWVKDRERNEALDCRVYARAAASMAGLDRMKEHDFDKFRVQPLENPKIADKTGEGSKGSKPKPKREIKKRSARESSFWP
jgi:phage terminase large subunit GpA-like protein